MKKNKKTKKQKIKPATGVLILSVIFLAVLVIVFIFLPRENIKSNSDLICRREVPKTNCTCNLEEEEWNVDTRSRTCTGTGVERAEQWYYSSTRISCDAGWSSERLGPLGTVEGMGETYGEIHTEGGGNYACQLTEERPDVYVTLSGGKKTCPESVEELNWASGYKKTAGKNIKIPEKESVKNCRVSVLSNGTWNEIEEGLPSSGSLSVTIPDNHNDEWQYRIECEDNFIPGAENVTDDTIFLNDTGKNEVIELFCAVNGECQERELGNEEEEGCPMPDNDYRYGEGCEGKSPGDSCEGGMGNWIETKITQ